MKGLHFAAALAAACAANASASTPVFGLPVGGKLTPVPKVCTFNEVGSRTLKAMCWVSKPFVSKDGGKLGQLQLPNPDGRPEWAAYGKFEASLAKDGTLEWLRVTVTEDGRQKHAIAESISKRFGLPLETTLPRQQYAKAKWQGEGIGIHQICTVDMCEVTFLSPAALKEAEEMQAAAERRKAARPATP